MSITIVEQVFTYILYFNQINIGQYLLRAKTKVLSYLLIPKNEQTKNKIVISFKYETSSKIISCNHCLNFYLHIVI